MDKKTETEDQHWDRIIRDNVRRSTIIRIGNFCGVTILTVFVTVMIDYFGVLSPWSCFFWGAALWNWHAATVVMSCGEEFPIPNKYPELQWAAVVVIATAVNATVAAYTPLFWGAFAALEIGGAVMLVITIFVLMMIPENPPWPPRWG